MTITRPGSSYTETVTGLPSGVIEKYTTISNSPLGGIDFAGSSTGATGNYPVTITAAESGQTTSQTFTLVSAPAAKAGAATDTTLSLQTTESNDVEVLATKDSDNSVVVDLSELGSFTSGSIFTFDAKSSTATAPTPVSFTPAARIPITLNGYGTTFLTLKP